MKIRHSTQADVAAFIAGLGAVVRLIPVSGDLRLCRDPNDDIILETAIRGAATYVVSRDEEVTRDLDLVDHLRKQGIEPITVQRFLALL